MSYYQDLSPYKYQEMDLCVIPKPKVNVGWLDRWHLYRIGIVSSDAKERIRKLTYSHILFAGGRHCCNLCLFGWLRTGGIKLTTYGAPVQVGAAEVRVFGDGIIYASPDMLYHYVSRHFYKPPDVFLDALMQGPEPCSERYLDILFDHYPSAELELRAFHEWLLSEGKVSFLEMPGFMETKTSKERIKFAYDNGLIADFSSLKFQEIETVIIGFYDLLIDGRMAREIWLSKKRLDPSSWDLISDPEILQLVVDTRFEFREISERYGWDIEVANLWGIDEPDSIPDSWSKFSQ